MYSFVRGYLVSKNVKSWKTQPLQGIRSQYFVACEGIMLKENTPNKSPQQ